MDLTMWDCQTEVAHLLCSRICGVALRSSFSGRFSFRDHYDISLTELCALPLGEGEGVSGRPWL